MQSFTRDDAKKILSKRKDRCLVVPEGFTETTGDFALLFDEDCFIYHFKNIHIPSTIIQFNGIFLTEDPYLTEIKMFKEITVSPENEHYCSVNGVLFSKDMKELVAFPSGKYAKVYSIPIGVEKIADGAFADNRFIKKIVLPDTIRYIGAQAFRNSENLKEINLPKGIEFIGKESFMFAGDMHRIIIPDSIETMDGSNITSANVMIFPESLKTIETEALQTEYTGTFVAPVLLSHNNLIVEDFAETYDFNYFSDYVIDDDGIIWSADRSILIDFPQDWYEDTYIVPKTIHKVFRWAFNHADIKHVVFDHPVEIIGKSSGNDFSRLSSVDAIGYDKNFLVRKFTSLNSESSKYESVKNQEMMHPYSGEKAYMFISYAHKDKQEVYPVINKLLDDGFRVWYDDGIDPGTEWDENIAKHIEECGYFIPFISENYLKSSNCKDELNFARDLDKDRFLVYLENVNLPSGMNMRLSRLQNIHKYAYDSFDEFYNKLLSAKGIDTFAGQDSVEKNKKIKENKYTEMGIIALPGSEGMAEKINDHLTKLEFDLSTKKTDSYIISSYFPRSNTGEGKCIIEEDVADHDLFIICDLYNYSCTYYMRGYMIPMSPDAHYADLKNAIKTINGQANRITVIIPMLYDGIIANKSLKCKDMLDDMFYNLGIDSVITFDAYIDNEEKYKENKILKNQIPYKELADTLKEILEESFFDNDKTIVISNESDTTKRGEVYSKLFGLKFGSIYKEYNLSSIANGKNPTVNIELSKDISKYQNIILVTDIALSENIEAYCEKIKEYGDKKIYILATFGNFSDGLYCCDRAYCNNLFEKIICTNLTCAEDELSSREWYMEVDMSNSISDIIYNHHNDI